MSARVCGGCHGARKPTRKPAAPGSAAAQDSPLGQYLKSRHGQARAAGRAGAASCADCHGSHDVRAADDPEGKVARARIAETCGACHGDPAAMGEVRLPHDQLSQWQRSVHGLRFAAELTQVAAGAGGTGPAVGTEAAATPAPAKGTATATAKGTAESGEGARTAPTCTDCHGVHAIGRGDQGVDGCKGCHADIWSAFGGGPHAGAFARKGFLPCVDCHGSHGVQAASPSLIGVDHGAACRRCHAAGQPMFEDISTLADRTRRAEALATDALAATESAGDALAARAVEDARRVLRLQLHALSVEHILSAAEALEQLAAPLAEAAREREAHAGVRSPAPSPAPGPAPPSSGVGIDAPPSSGVGTGAHWSAYALLVFGIGLLILALLRRGSGGRP